MSIDLFFYIVCICTISIITVIKSYKNRSSLNEFIHDLIGSILLDSVLAILLIVIYKSLNIF